MHLLSDKGCERPSNEDCGHLITPTGSTPGARSGLLALVADGMGGHAAGEIASRLAAEVVSDFYYSRRRGEPHRLLERAYRAANKAIWSEAGRNPDYRGMGTTCTTLVLSGGTAYSAHVGDSRLYLIRDDSIYLLTEDHSAVMHMVRHGVIGRAAARLHEDKNIILRALGTRPDIQVQTWGRPFPARAGDRFLLCTDGLSDLLEDDEIEQLVRRQPPQPACEALVAQAKERGGHDNITVALVELKAAA